MPSGAIKFKNAMKAIITGLNGTVGPVVREELARAGGEVIGWDRAQVPPSDHKAIRDFIWREKPDRVFHFAMGDPAWAEEIARVCRDLCIRFLFTSSVSVYAHTQAGPHAPQDRPEPEDDYGRYKMECEQRIASVNPDAVIARIGWQIGETPAGNNMMAYFDRQQKEHGVIKASTRWIPACSFLKDTAAVLAAMIERSWPGGLYHVEGNPGLNIAEIAEMLKDRHKANWMIQSIHEFQMDNRMKDARVDRIFGPMLNITQR